MDNDYKNKSKQKLKEIKKKQKQKQKTSNQDERKAPTPTTKHMRTEDDETGFITKCLCGFLIFFYTCRCVSSWLYTRTFVYFRSS